MTLQFREWLFVENTVSQSLKINPDKAAVTYIQSEVIKTLKLQDWARNIADNQLDSLVKLFTYWIILMQEKTKQLTQDNAVKHKDLWSGDQIRILITRTFLRNSSDYLAFLLTSQSNIARSKFNNPQYTLKSLEKDSENWHEKIALQKRKGADPGRRVDIPGMPAGYYWVSLDRSSCDKEADAMGHCGNSGYTQGDVIWSLRDSKGIPHLTFIVNNKILGESKGFANNKPEAKYHPHIVALLLGNDNGESIIEHVRGGGYKPENNFYIEDLEKGLQEKLLAEKPQLNDYFTYLKTIAGNNEKKWKELIDDAFGFDFTRIDIPNQTIIVKEFGDISQMIEWLKDNTESKLDEIPDLDGMENHDDYQIDLDNAIDHFENYANKNNEQLMEKIIAEIEKENEDEDDDEEHDLKWACEKNDEVRNAIRWSCEDGWRSGSEGERFNHVSKFFKKEEDHNSLGFITDASYGGGWYIYISMKDLEALYKSQIQDDPDYWTDNYNNLSNHIEYHYEAPYNGYNDFDKEHYNERLKEMLEEVLDSFRRGQPE